MANDTKPTSQPNKSELSSADAHLAARLELRRAALEYHEFPTPGKISIQATKQLINQHDLALAYTPGVAAPCEEIVKDPNAAYRYTSRGNLVAVITNGTAIDPGAPIVCTNGLFSTLGARTPAFIRFKPAANLSNLAGIIRSSERLNGLMIKGGLDSFI